VRASCLVLTLLAVPAVAGTVTGRVEVVEKGRRLADLSGTVISIQGVKARTPPTSATVRMMGKAFSPRVVAVPVGGTVHFPNEDNILHNAFSVSRPNAFDLKLYKRPKSGSVTFRHPGTVHVYCNIHPQMSAVVLVQGDALFTMAAADGTFVLEGVPAGRHTVKAWHERAGQAEAAVTVAAEGSAAASLLRLDASNYRRQPHKRKDGSDYGNAERY
jgi:plastocyanin